MASHNFKNISGQVFGVWTVLGRAGRTRAKHITWRCRCVCGVESVVRGDALRLRDHVDCWHGAPVCAEPEYRSWNHMKARCYNSNDGKFKHYGGRGIVVCDHWRERFENFLADMGPRPSSRHSIERRDVNGNYEPGNCVWATAKEQSRNTQRTVFVEHDGVRRKLVELVEELKLSRDVVHARLKLGWSLPDALAIPVRRYNKALDIS